MMCHTTQMSFEVVQEPTGACGAEEIENVSVNHHHCQFEGTEDIFHSIGTSTGCAASSCFDENGNSTKSVALLPTRRVSPQQGERGLQQVRAGVGRTRGLGLVTQVGATGPEGFPLRLAGTTSFELEGDFELADGSVAPDGAALEIPSPGTNVSGIGLISGWSCLGGELEVEFSDADGVIETMTVLQGAERLDTETECGDIDNGFSATYNWSRLGAGEKTARLIRNGEEVASHTFMVTAFDTEFVTEAEGMCTIADFPEMGKNATFVWEQSQQGLVLEAVN